MPTRAHRIRRHTILWAWRGLVAAAFAGMAIAVVSNWRSIKANGAAIGSNRAALEALEKVRTACLDAGADGSP